MPVHIVLYQPEIPPNTGNVIRLCANTGATLHLIKPLGFVLDDKRLVRAGLDYHEFATVTEWDHLEDYLNAYPERRLVAVETGGQGVYSDFEYSDRDSLLFGPETRGLPESILKILSDEQIIRLPMRPKSRSLNLSNAVAIVTYEAWRRLGFPSAQ